MNKDTKNYTFEENLKKLEDIVDQLESGEIDLEKSVELYEKGMKLKNNCEKAVECYGNNNKERLSGRCETASWDNFSYSVGGRDVSVRIGYETAKNGKGYFEDRRPGGNLEPYLVTSYITQTICE